MAFTKVRNLVALGAGTGGRFEPYFHKGDVDLVIAASDEIVGTRIMRAVYNIEGVDEQIFVLVGVTDVSDTSNPIVFGRPNKESTDSDTDFGALAAMPCPPLDKVDSGKELDDRGNEMNGA